MTNLLRRKVIRATGFSNKQQINKKYNVFDPVGTDKGEFVNDWRLGLNISRNEILGICNKQY